MQSTIKNPLEPQDLKDLKDGLQTAGTTLNGEMEANGEARMTKAGTTLNGTMEANGEMEPNGEMEVNGITEVKDLRDGLPINGTTLNGTTEHNGEMGVMTGTTLNGTMEANGEARMTKAGTILNGEMEANGEARMTKAGTTLNGEMEPKDGTTLCQNIKIMPPINHLPKTLTIDSLNENSINYFFICYF
jgi:hypothetical protein